MPKGSLLLREWRVKKKKISQRQAADLLGLNQMQVSRLERGERPGLANALKIENGTDGVVPASSWRDELSRKAS